MTLQPISFKLGTSESEVVWQPWQDAINSLVSRRRVLIVIERSVAQLCRAFVDNTRAIEIPGGEECKNLSQVSELYAQCKRYEIDRDSVLVAIGGGAVTDLVGFVAATYLRGLETWFVPTTLLAQVDAAIGGKNGVNFEGAKNQIGAIHHPRKVICDSSWFTTLPEREFRSGFAEIIKVAVVRDRSLFEDLSRSVESLIARETRALDAVVYRAVHNKIECVVADERDRGQRVLLNFGHTIGHVLEAEGGILHGEAVAAGMVIESMVARSIGKFSEGDGARVAALIRSFGFDTSLRPSLDALHCRVVRDKKRSGSFITLPLPESIGTARVIDVAIEDFINAVIAIF